MRIVENDVFRAGGGHVGCQALFPNPFRYPHAANLCAQAVFQIIAIAANLPDPIARGNHRQNRLEEGAADDFHSPRRHQRRQAIQIFRMMRIEPFDQRAAGVQRDLELRVAFEQIEKRPVAVLIGLLENTIEVADRLMIVQNEQKSNRMRHCSLAGQWAEPIVCRARDKATVGRF